MTNVAVSVPSISSSLVQSDVAHSQIDPNSIQKHICCLKLTSSQSFYYLRWNILLTGFVYLMIDTCVNEVVHLFF